MVIINRIKIDGFEWDTGNRDKNEIKHEVKQKECEESFFNEPLLISEDIQHSKIEKRLYLLGRTNNGRPLFISFTIRNNKIRVISARDQSNKEKTIYKNYKLS